MRRLIVIGIFWIGMGIPHAQAQFVGCPNIQQVGRVECEALVKLYDLANGPNWFNNTGWAVGNQPCNWFGVRCNISPWPRKITGIRLHNNNVGGVIPAELGLLPELRELILDNTPGGVSLSRLTGTIPSGLGDLQHLEILQLGTNALKGGIPPELGRLKTLKVLDLSYNELKGSIPFELGNLADLERLDVSHNQLDRGIPPALGQLDSLRALNVSHNLLTGPLPETLGNLNALESLDVSHNQLDGPVPVALSRLDHLFRLVLSDNQFSGVLPPKVARLGAELLNCALEGNHPALCIPASAPYAGLGKTDICGLPLDAACQACTASDATCQTLEQFYTQTEGLDWAQDAGWLAIPTWCAWQGVTCTDGQLTALHLAQNNLAGPLPEALGTHTTLAMLDLSGNALTGPVPEAWAGLTQLATLNLSNNNLSGVVTLPLAEVLATVAPCTLSGNEVSLCVPDTPAYRALGQNPLCGLPLAPTCADPAQVTFAAFTARVKGASVLLQWTITGPAAEGGFAVQRRTGDAFETLDTVPGTEATQYMYEVEEGTGLKTYRIAWSGPTGTIQTTAEQTVVVAPTGLVVEQVYPQPATLGATLRFGVASDALVQVRLYDALGRLVQTLFEGQVAAEAPQTLGINTQDLPGGWYVARVEVAGVLAVHRPVMVVR